MSQRLATLLTATADAKPENVRAATDATHAAAIAALMTEAALDAGLVAGCDAALAWLELEGEEREALLARVRLERAEVLSRFLRGTGVMSALLEAREPDSLDVRALAHHLVRVAGELGDGTPDPGVKEATERAAVAILEEAALLVGVMACDA